MIVCWRKKRKEGERKRGESEKRLSCSKGASWSLAVPDGRLNLQARRYLASGYQKNRPLEA
jgi:hypothetical protein